MQGSPDSRRNGVSSFVHLVTLLVAGMTSRRTTWSRRTIAPLSSWTVPVRVVRQRLLRPTGHFRRRSLSQVVRQHDAMSTLKAYTLCDWCGAPVQAANLASHKAKRCPKAPTDAVAARQPRPAKPSRNSSKRRRGFSMEPERAAYYAYMRDQRDSMSD